MGGFLVALRFKGETADEIAGCAEAMREHVLAVQPEARRPRRHRRAPAATTRTRSTSPPPPRSSPPPRARASRSTATAPCRRAPARPTCSRRSASRSSCRRSGSSSRSTSSASASSSRPRTIRRCGTRRPCGGARDAHGLQRARPADEPGRRAGAGRRRLLGRARADDRATCSRSSARERAFVVHGAAGIDELSPAGPNLVCEVVDGAGASSATIDPLELGIPRCDPAELRGGSPRRTRRRSARSSRAQTAAAARDAVLLNAAGAIAAAGHADDLREGLELAREAVDERRRRGAARALASWRFSGGANGTRLATRSARAGPRRDRRVQAALALGRRPPARRRSGRARRRVRARGRGRGLDPRRRALRRHRSADLKSARAAAPTCRCSRRASSREELQLLQTKLAGADAALLLLRDLDDERARALMAYAARARARHARRGARRGGARARASRSARR